MTPLRTVLRWDARALARSRAAWTALAVLAVATALAVYSGARFRARWSDEAHAVRGFRRHATWYTKGFPGSARHRQDLTRIETLDALRRCVEAFDPEAEFPVSAMRVPRGKTGGTQKVALPAGYLDDLQDATPPCAEAEDPTSGG